MPVLSSRKPLSPSQRPFDLGMCRSASLERAYDLTKVQSESNNLHNSLEEEHKMPYNRHFFKNSRHSPATSILGDSFERESPDFSVNKHMHERQPSPMHTKTQIQSTTELQRERKSSKL